MLSHVKPLPSSPSTGTLSHSDRLREYLLRLTIDHAVSSSPFYARRIGRRAGRIRTLGDLAALPVLRKAEIQESFDEIVTFDRFPDHLMYTSGTTGKPLEVPVYQEESDAYERFVLPVWHRHLLDPPLTLSVIRIGHGSHILSSSIPSLPCHIQFGLEQFIQMMESTHRVGRSYVRVGLLDANVLSIRQITAGLLAEGIDPRRFGLETMVLAGWYLPEWERRFLEDTWGATLLQRYGVTEVHGDAKWCPTCGYYHFDFTVIPEVVDPDTGEPIEEGIGSMLLTGLYPFNQAVPKLRYELGDIVEVRHTDCPSSERGVRFLGRLRDVVRAPEGSAVRYRLFSTDVAEALAPLPDVGRRRDTGFLEFRLSTRPDGEALIEVELTYPPARFPDRVQELRKQIGRTLAARSGACGSPVIEFLRPGELGPITKL